MIYADHEYPVESGSLASALKAVGEYMGFNGGPPDGVVFLLGAGCSMQYGLPGFGELTEEIEQDDGSLEAIMAGLDTAARRRVLKRHLQIADGAFCPGYVYLARLLKEERIRAVVNMNFDVLLEQACLSIGYSPNVKNTIDGERPGAIYKIHGSIDEAGGKPIITLDETEFFRDKDKAAALHGLLTRNHVVVMGYSFGDADLRNILRTVEDSGRSADPRKLFIFDAGRISPEIVPVVRMRKSEQMAVAGSQASFENVMEGLWRLRQGGAGAKKIRPNRRSLFLSWEHSSRMTQAEQVALDSCFRMAMEIRASIHVAETSRISLEEHARDIFSKCLQLASSAGNALTSPERYLLYCVSILHDLGYFVGYSQGEISRSRGWWFLNNHGAMTADLLEDRFLKNPEICEEIYPATYRSSDRGWFLKRLVDLCHCHTLSQPFNSVGARQIQVVDIAVPVRFQLLHALFATAEEITHGHPFLPSTDPVRQSTHNGDSPVIEDPVLDLYLRRKEGEVEFEIQRRGVVAKEGKASSPNARSWLLTMAKDAVSRFDEVSKENGGRGVAFHVDFPEELPEVPSEEHLLISEALEELLKESLDDISEGVTGRHSEICDLIAIFSIGRTETKSPEGLGRTDERREWIQKLHLERKVGKEPRVDLQSSAVVKACLDDQSHPQGPRRNLLWRYLLIARKSESRSSMEREFQSCYETILYPAWRFCAREWREGIDAINMARSSLDFGSSRYRGEVGVGIPQLFGKKINWERGHAMGHGGCTICTARLLYVIAHLRLLHTKEDFARYKFGWEEKTFAQITQGLLGFFLSRSPDDESWWGTNSIGIRSADYLAWAIRALALVLAADRSLADSRGAEEAWLQSECEVDRDAVEDLLVDLWSMLSQADHDQDLMSEEAEEPHSYLLGEVAITALGLKALRRRRLLDVDLGDRSFVTLTRSIQKAMESLQKPKLSLLSQFYTLPAKILIHSHADDLGLGTGNEEERARELLASCRKCTDCSVWIRGGEDAGSWGYNNENTQRLASSLTEVWRYFLERRNVFEPLFKETQAAP